LNNSNKLSPGMLVFFLFLLLSVIANVVMLALNLGPIF
jgi:ABC-type multidrug transport system fused ATPase/permease subunit